VQLVPPSCGALLHDVQSHPVGESWTHLILVWDHVEAMAAHLQQQLPAISDSGLEIGCISHLGHGVDEGALFLRHQVVSDLRWVLASPHLLRAHAAPYVPLFSDTAALDLERASREWLQELDANPSPLRNFLVSRKENHRMGHCFAVLLEFWLRFCPAVGADHVMARQDAATVSHGGVDGACNATEDDDVGSDVETVGAATDACAHSVVALPITASAAEKARTLKYLVRSARGGTFRWEAAIDFALAKGLEEVDIAASRFSGACLHESLCWRVLEARTRLCLVKEPSVVEWLLSELGTLPEPSFLIRGYVFDYALLVLSSGNSTRAAPPLEGSLPPLAKQVLPDGCTNMWRFLSSHHAVGWWTHDVSLLPKPPRHMSLWVLLEHKRYWISPALGVEVPGSDPRRVLLECDQTFRLKPL